MPEENTKTNSRPSSRFLTELEAVTLLADRGVFYPKHQLARSAEEAAAAANRLGYPVVMKIVSSVVVHKSEIGGVEINLTDVPSVKEAFARIVGRVRSRLPNADIHGVLVCRQAEPSVEVIVGAMRDSVFGPTVMCGLGGVFTEVLKDVSFRVAPIIEVDAIEMIEELQGYAVLCGARGAEPSDLEALVSLLIKIADLVHQRTDILELDLNPVRIYAHGLLALDARIKIDETVNC